MVELGEQVMIDIRIRKVKTLSAKQRERVKDLTDDDLVIVRTTAQKITGSPILALQKSVRQWRQDSI